MKELQLRAKEGKAARDRLRRSARARRVLGFLVAKKLLIDEAVTPLHRVKLSLPDVFWVAEQLEPRVLEVLPAALIHFPSGFDTRGEIPDDLKNVLRAIQDGRADGPDFRGVPFGKAKLWAGLELADKRTRPSGRKRVMRSFRLQPRLAEALREKARAKGISETELLERLIDNS